MATVGVRKGFKFLAKSKPLEAEKIVFDDVEGESTTTPHKNKVVNYSKSTEKKTRKNEEAVER